MRPHPRCWLCRKCEALQLDRSYSKDAELSGISANHASSRDLPRLHDLRHYFASGLIAAGCDVVTVQRALGHSNATTTRNTYSHLWPTAEDRTRKAAEAMMRAAAADLADSVRTNAVGDGSDLRGGR